MNFLKRLWTWETLLLLLLLFFAAITHGWNMFHFPYYENDEGVYISQAWSLVTQGKMAPYTYWYDHAPGGWILIALWSLVSGGFFTFGFSINNGRVLMLILHVLSCFFLFKIGKRLFTSVIPGIIAILFFSLSPLGVYFQRRVLLDNIMIFWILLSLFCLTFPKIKLRHIVISAMGFGIGILSKENAIFFFPGFIALLLVRLHKTHRNFALGLWFAIVGFVVSLYFLYAFVKDELFPSGTLLGGTQQHVSLLGSLEQQYKRGDGAPFLDIAHNIFWHNFFYWLQTDKLLIIAGMVATVLCLLFGLKNKYLLCISFLSLAFWVFLIRGGVVIEFYIVPLIPILGLCIGAAVWQLFTLFHKQKVYKLGAGLCLLMILAVYGLNKGQARGLNLYTSDQTKPQIQAIAWIKKNLSPKSFLVIDNYGYVDLHDKSRNKTDFGYAEWYWKVDKDPAIRDALLKNNPANITYIALTPQMQNDMRASGLSMIIDASHNASPIARFWQDGWGVEFWSTRYPQQILQKTWVSYKKDFMTPDGKTVDPYNNNVTTSEAQSYAMLRSVWLGDKTQFDTTWNWTKNNMQLPNNLFRWKIEPTASDVADNGSATDADEDIALALAFAYKRWAYKTYLTDASAIIQSIWSYDTKTIQKTPYIVAGDWEADKEVAIINPSYFAPYSYRIFGQIDKSHNWQALVDSSYAALLSCSQNKLDKKTSANLPPDWCAIDSKGKVITSPEKGLNATNYSYDAFRSTWRIAVDYLWNKDARAKKLLSENDFLQKQWSTKKQLIASYTHDGKPWDNYETVTAYAADIGSFMLTDQSAAATIYKNEILAKLYTSNNNNYWEDPKNYYAQNWAWFGTALYTNNLPNLWQQPTPQLARK